MFQNLAQELTNQQWGTKITVDGRNHDTGVQALAEKLAAMFEAMSKAPISISQPIYINNYSGGPAFIINQLGGDARSFQTQMPDGTFSSIGVGLGNQGVVANELVPMLAWAIPPEATDQLQSLGNRGGGSVTETPGEGFTQTNPKNTGVLGGVGYVPDNMPLEPGTGGGIFGSGYKVNGGYPPPPPSFQTGSGGGLGSYGNTTLGSTSNGGGGDTTRLGTFMGLGKQYYDHVVEMFGGITAAIHSFRNGSFRWGNKTWYVNENALTGGLTGSQAIVTAVSCTAGTLSVTSKTMTYTNGLITGMA